MQQMKNGSRRLVLPTTDNYKFPPAGVVFFKATKGNLIIIKISKTQACPCISQSMIYMLSCKKKLKENIFIQILSVYSVPCIQTNVVISLYAT